MIPARLIQPVRRFAGRRPARLAAALLAAVIALTAVPTRSAFSQGLVQQIPVLNRALEGSAPGSATTGADEAPVVVPPAPEEVFITSATAAPIAAGPLMVVNDGTSVAVREMDEESFPLQILPKVMQLLLRKNQKQFEYDAKGEEDPMVIPWVRKEILAAEHLTAAKKLLAEAEVVPEKDLKLKIYLKAIEEFDRVIEMDPSARFGKEAQAFRDKSREAIDRIQQADRVGNTPPPPPKPPEWVVLNTKAIIFDQSPEKKHIALVGDNMLKVNDTVPRYPAVKIVEIQRDVVVYEFQYEANRTLRFPVNVQVEVKME
jgi:hypothetical protein